jgi:hypothetical protein
MATLQEKYDHMRANAEAFVKSISAMVAKAERDGNEDLACNLRVWALTPWQAAIRDDDSGDLWPSCEVCSNHIKNDAEVVSSEDGCYFHRSCVEQ